MKWNLSNSIATLFSASLLCLSSHSLVSASSPDDLTSIFQTFRKSKNIGFGGAIGGASHFNWVLSIMDELSDRGHNITFLTMDDGVRFGKPYPNINTVSIGAPYAFDRAELLGDPKKSTQMLSMAPKAMKFLYENMEQEYTTMSDFIKLYNLDLILCDHVFTLCADAATEANIPFIITSALEMTTDSAAPYINNNMFNMFEPTTENQSLWTRFNNEFVLPTRLMKIMWSFNKDVQERKKALGITSSGNQNVDWKDSLKLVNSVFGLTPARPMGPLVETVGPIMPKKYQPLDDDLKNYLDSHKRVAYIAFGQHAIPRKQDIHVILTALLESIESKDIDAFLWSTVHAGDRFPDYITTSSNTTYNVVDMFENKNPNARMVKFSPQTAILFHPSTYLFVSHGGVGSWIESLYAGVRMVIFPFFTDQPGNAILSERAKVGGILRRDHTPQEATALFRRIARDEDGEITKGVERFQSLVQIHSSHGILKGADAVEEVAFVNVNSKLPHRYPASRNMNYLKANNYDIYGILVLIVLASFYVLIHGSKMAYKTVTSSFNQKKMKTL